MTEANSRRNDPNVDGAYGRSKDGAHRAVPQQGHVVDAVGAGDHPGDQRAHLRPGVGALVGRHAEVLVGQRGQAAFGGPGRPSGPGRRTTPDSGHRSSLRLRGECEIVASTRCPSLWPNLILEKSHSSTTTGHFGVTTHSGPPPNRCIQAKRLSTNRCRHLHTVCGHTPASAATSLLDFPAAKPNTIRDRSGEPDGQVVAGAGAASRRVDGPFRGQPLTDGPLHSPPRPLGETIVKH